MTIEQVTITDNELNEAVGLWLSGKGIQIPVERVHKKYSYSMEWTVDFKEANPPAPMPVEPEPETKG